METIEGTESLPRPDRRHWAVWITAFVALINGIATVAQVLATRYPRPTELFAWFLPFGFHHWARSITAVLGFMLIYLSVNLFQRKHLAWWLALAASLAAVVAHGGAGRHLTGALPAGLAAAFLIVFRRRFTVRSEPSSIAQGLALVALSLLVALAYGTLGFWWLDRRDLGMNFQVGEALVRTLREYALVGNGDLHAHTHRAHWFLDSLSIMGGAAIAFAAFSLFRPLAHRLRTLPHERARTAELLERHGRSALDYFKLWPDKSYFFNDDESAAIAYKVAWGVALALGDPVGPAEAFPALIRDFAVRSAENGWYPAFHQVLPELVPLYKRLGFQVLKAGEDAVVDLERFAAVTSEKKDIRRVRRKVSELGVTGRRHVPPHDPELLRAVAEVSDEWLSIPGRRERTFTLGTFDRNYVAGTPLFSARDADGRVIAFVNEIPSYRAGDATVDLMRHRREVPNGVMDFLFIELLLALRERGYRTFNLGLAPFSGVGDRPGASLEERAMHQVYERLNRFFSYKGLRSYKAKFEPVWEERFLVYQGGPAGLVRTAIALTRATEG